MSDAQPSVAPATGATAEVSAPTTPGPEGTVAGTDGGTEAPPEPPSYIDLDQYGTHHVKVRVDGDDVDVPLAEALQGYSRQQDYTRKTQALAEQQRAAQFGLTLQQALANNPEATLRLLQDQYGVAPAQTTGDDDSWLDDDDPVERRLADYERRIAEHDQYRADQELRAAIRVLQQRYGDDFNPQEVVGRAVASGRMDLEAIHKEMMFDRTWTQQQAAREAEQRRAAEDQARQQAAAAITSHGGGVPSSAVSTELPQPRTVAEAWAAAKQQHNR